MRNSNILYIFAVPNLENKFNLIHKDMDIKINISDKELMNIASNCINSQEFAVHVSNLIGLRLNDNVLAELREVYRKLSTKIEEEKAWDKYDTIIALLNAKGLNKIIYYEAWIDLEETWLDKWSSVFRLLNDEQIAAACERYLFERERFYHSSDYIDMLNGLLNEMED